MICLKRLPGRTYVPVTASEKILQPAYGRRRLPMNAHKKGFKKVPCLARKGLRSGVCVYASKKLLQLLCAAMCLKRLPVEE